MTLPSSFLVFALRWITIAMWLSGPFCAGQSREPAGIERESPFIVDYEQLVSRANVFYGTPTRRADEGLPIGNGTMGTLVWTDPSKPSTILVQPNRVDTFGMDRTHKHYDPDIMPGSKAEKTNNLLSLCRVRIDLDGAEFNKQSLQPYEGIVRLHYTTADVEMFVSATQDLLVTNVAPVGRAAQAVSIDLSMIRLPAERFGQNQRQYTITNNDGIVVVVQTVREETYFMSYAVALDVHGGPFEVASSEVNRITLTGSQTDKPIRVLLSSAATNDEREDVRSKAISILRTATETPYETLRQEHRDWWSAFWRDCRTYVHLASEDGVADYLEARYTLQLYTMGSSSRGSLPPLYNGSLWACSTDDRRAWGAQYKYWNDSMSLFPLYASNHLALTDPYLSMIRRLLPDFETAARQRWGVKHGAYVPETFGPSGPIILSQAAAPLVHDVLMGRRTRASLPPEVIKACMAGDALAWINPKYQNVKNDQYTWTSHILSSGAGIAMQFWWRYELTGDRVWLRDNAYPMMKAIVDFYADYAKKGDDGLYHIYPSNVHETYWGVRDGIMDLAAVRTLVPKVIAASKLLGIDDARRPEWQGFLDQLAPYPTVDDPDVELLQSSFPKAARVGTRIPSFPNGAFGAGHGVDSMGSHNVDPVWVLPLFPYESISMARGLYTGTPEDRKNFHTMLNTYPAVPPTWYGFMWPSYPSRLGLVDEVERILPAYAAKTQSTPNGMEGSWGMANSGLLSDGIQSALLQSQDGLIIVSPAWPKHWDADFQLMARGGFLIATSVRQGMPTAVRVESTFGTECKIVNPWPNEAVAVQRNGKEAELVSGANLSVQLQQGDVFVLTPGTQRREFNPLKSTFGQHKGPLRLSVTLPNGKQVEATIGK